MDKRIVTNKVKCPKCGNKKNLYLVEEWVGHTIEFTVDDGKFDLSEGVMNPGDPHRVSAHCANCRHCWRLKKAKNIYDTFYL